MIGEIILGTTIIAGFYSLYKYETDNIEKVEYIIENEKIPKDFDKFNIVQISDLHNKSFGKENNRLLSTIDELEPDIVVITGDLVDGDSKNFEVALKFIYDITKKYNVYHIIGNHEQKALIKKYRDLYKSYFKDLYDSKVINLNNEYIRIENKNSYINLYGLSIPFDCYTYLFNGGSRSSIDKNYINNVLGNINDKEYNILLSHSPFFFEEYSKWGADLVISGHVHGGIIRIPKIGGLLSPNREFFPKYDLGKYTTNNSSMILSKGLGGSKLLMRINCRPEVVKIILRSS